jgi:hypothetical protein
LNARLESLAWKDWSWVRKDQGCAFGKLNRSSESLEAERTGKGLGEKLWGVYQDGGNLEGGDGLRHTGFECLTVHHRTLGHHVGL